MCIYILYIYICIYVCNYIFESADVVLDGSFKNPNVAQIPASGIQNGKN